MYQSTANSNAFVMGSVRISIPTSTGGYIPLGAARGVKVTEAWEPYEIEVDNCPLVIKGIKNQTITVEGTLLEVNFQRLAALRGGIDFSSFTVASTMMTFASGGNVTITPKAIYLTHIAASTAGTSTETITTTINWASVTDPMVIPFPSDSGNDVAEIPFKVKGTCQSSVTVGTQLYSIIDLRNNIYSTAQFQLYK